ncbi:hypothetical protein MA20_01740 [Bradyrhizobium japonicum]|uniref:Uncharacterized protein n=1 Tax=Bradyrhizobium japonicum TaxID=375 RepID=A0A0A3Y7J7_BRAJP|nr:hypothetical protein MA20_01740 [Bradyrhizobium japonicum]
MSGWIADIQSNGARSQRHLQDKLFGQSLPVDIGLTEPSQMLHAYPVSRPDGRSGRCRKAAGEESPGSLDIRCRITSGGGNPRESATENEPPRFAFGFAG